MMPDFHNQKNIFKFLERKYWKINFNSESNLNFFKEKLKEDYNAEQLKELSSKTKMKNMSSYIYTGDKLIYAIFSTFLAALITGFISYTSINIHRIVNFSNNILHIRLQEADNVKEKEELVRSMNEIINESIVGLFDIFNLGLLMTFMILLIVSFVLALYQTYKKTRRKMYEFVIEECFNEKAINIREANDER